MTVRERVLTARIIERVRKNNITTSDIGFEIVSSSVVKVPKRALRLKRDIKKCK